MNASKNIDIPLAIVGMACRLPGADGLAQYWELISQGKSPIAEVPSDRLNQELYYNPQRGVRGKSYCKLASLLENREFDRARCPIPDDLIDSVDNTHLLMTGVAADALRHAGLDPFNLPTRNTAVFIGHAQGSSRLGEVIYREYLDEAISLLDQVDGWREMPPTDRAALHQELIHRLRSRLPPEGTGARNLHCNMVSGTIAKAFGLTGPWLALNSACASSLHAMLMGARALQLGRADMVIVGGASDCKSDSLVLFSAAQAMSQRGSSPFDAGADGLIMAEGYVALVMKTLDRAIADGNPVQAVVRGLGIASDGRGKSLWAPRKEGQVKAMRRAYRSGVEMSGVQYLEAHATGTQLGDATELSTLAEVLGPELPAGRKIPVTSVKANIGHSLECAGIAGMIKTVLCMQRQVIPQAINVTTLDPEIDWKSAPYYVPLAPDSWQAPVGGGPRRAAVNAFGIGGLNMHVVIDEYTPASQALIQAAQAKPVVSADDRAVAIIGMSCIFPGANGLPKFWEALMAGSDPKSAATDKRWPRSSLADKTQKQKATTGGFITDFEYDWRKHKVPPKQVAEADPLQFMLLEAAERALADAGYDKKPLDREHCGVIVGTEFGGDFGDHLEMGLRLPEMQHAVGELLRRRGMSNEQIEAVNSKFADILLKKWPSLVDETGSFTSSTLASRITKTLDLAGGAVSIDSGATSAMSSLAVGIDMLLAGDNDMIICTAGQRHMDPCAFDALEAAGLLAGSKPHNVLDANYDGVVPAEGVGVVVLKRLADARRDGDRVHAIIRGLGIAHHDSHSEALRLASERALAMAGVDAGEITIAELDTDEQLSPAGDELQVLAAAHASPNRQLPLTIGSATAQFGHLGGASGMAALIAASLEIENGKTAPLVGLQQPSAALQPWANIVRTPRGGENISGQRLASVACWSKGQACHLILEHGAPVPPSVKPATPAQAARPAVIATRPVPLAAAKAAPKVAEPVAAEWAICRFAGANIDQVLAQIAVTESAALWQTAKANSFKTDDRCRLAIVADGPEALVRKLALARPQLQNPAARNVLEQQGIFYRDVPKVRPRVAFVFPGQGSQYEGMLRDLVRDVPAAALAQREIDATMARLGYPTFSQLAWNSPSPLGNDIWATQLSMLQADAIVLAALRDLSIIPDVVLGHSYGEFVAIHASGSFDLETAARLTKARCDGIVAFASSGTGMLATDAPQDVIERVISRISRELYRANFNAPDQTVIGGRREQLNSLAAALQAESHQARILPVPAAFHTPLMTGASRLLEEGLRGAAVRAPQVILFSTVTNSLVHDANDIRRNLGSQLTTPVRYCQLIEQLASEQPTVFVEVGPQQTLTRLNRRILATGADAIACDNPKRAGLEPLLCVQAMLECLGACGPAKTLLVTPSSLSALKDSTGKSMMDDQIPHFDATERRRAKMRDNSHEHAAPKVNGTVPHGVSTNGTNGTNGTHAHGATNGSSPAGLAGYRPVPAPAAPTPPRKFAAPSQAPQQQNGSAAHHVPAAPKPVVSTYSAPNHAAPAPTPAGNGTKPVHQPVAPAPVASALASQAATTSRTAGPAIKELESFLVNFVVEQTGYPPEVVELDADLEADLGIDSIKKAQLFGELQEYFDVSTGAGNLSLDDFTTLRHVLNFLGGLEQGAAAAAPALPAPVPAVAPSPVHVQPVAVKPAPVVNQAAQAPAAAPASAAPNAAELESFLVNFVVEQTGYPPEVVELDADLEADLGIDSIKKAQLFGELQEYFDIGSSTTNLSLDDFTTLRHVLNFLSQSGSPASASLNVVEAVVPSLSEAGPVPIVPIPADAACLVAQPTDAPATNAAELESFLVNFVVEQTGYPPEVVELDADLEADLGIDSIKKAQLFGELQEYFDIGTTTTNLSLDDFTTLRHVLDFLSGAGNGAPAGQTAQANAQHSFATTEPAPAVASTHTIAPASNSVAAPAADIDQLQAFLINFVVEQTGYPPEVVELDADLEADLGIDSIKKAQLFGELQEYFEIGTATTNLSLDDFTTLRHVLNFLAGSSASEVANSEAPSAESSVEGTPYEIGWQYGQQQQAEIRRILRHNAYLAGDQPEAASVLARCANPEQWLSADELDELQGMADGAEVPLGNLLAHHFLAQAEPLRLVSSWRQAVQAEPTSSEMPELPGSHVTDRFVLEMREAPLTGAVASEPTWNGPALLFGCGATTDALRSRLQAAGVQVYELSLSSDIDRVVAELEQICSTGPVPHLFITTGRDGTPTDIYDEELWAQRRHETMVLPFFVCQKWLQLATVGNWADRCTLVAVTAEEGDFGFQRGANSPEGGALAGLLKAIFIEYTIMAANQKGPRVKVVDAPLSSTADALVNNIFRELASGNLDYEVGFQGDRRFVPFAVQKAVTAANASNIRQVGTWVVTGGARGITAACALELARRFELKLHLIGVTALPQIDPAWRGLDDAGKQKLKASVMIEARKAGKPAAQAWDRVQKDLEIDRSLQAFAAAGVQVTYHACDVADRAALSIVLDEIRQSDGPIEGILHGAGIDRSCRFDKKQRDVVLQTIGAKVDGAAHLMALTRRDPIRHFIGFGSISGRLGSYGQTDYCLASDMLCKLIGAYRRQRPWVKAVGFHWHPWDEVGMAARPETKSILQGKSDLHLMPLAEGIAHLVRELTAGAPEREVLITERRHWDRFAEGLGKLAGNEVGSRKSEVGMEQKQSPTVPVAEPRTVNGVDLTTYRCVLRTLVAPLPAGTPALPAFDSPVWILGNNAAATALEQKLSAAGVAVRRITAHTDLDQTLAKVDRLWAEQPAKYLFLMTGRDDKVGSIFDAAVMHQRRQQCMLLPFFVAQRWYKLLNGQPALGKGTIVAAVSLGGDFGFGGKAVTPDGGALDGLLKALHIEDSRRETSLVRAKVFDAPTGESPAALADWMLRELAANEPEVEVAVSAGIRRVVRPMPSPTAGRANRPLPCGGVWVVTGGARGITAIAALGLARRHGWKLHLVGKSPAPQIDAPWRDYSEAEMKKLKTTLARQAVAEGRSPSEAWDRVMKDCEIFKNLKQFTDAGVQATYHSCDISDRDALAAVLNEVRRQDGPIQGIMHGAGLIDPGRFESKRREFVSALISTKFNGAVNLMSLTRQDPLKFFIGFGSISGRFGGNGLSDYAAGNDVMSKAIDWFRAQRPECATGTIHWESWEGSGMATLPRFAFGPKSVMNMKYMTPEEGVERLDQELHAGLPESEVLYTFGEFYPMFYPDEQRALGEFVPGPLGAAPANAADQTLPLLKTIQREAAGCLGDMPLDPVQDSFLVQHRLRGKALFPVVVGLESLAEAAASASGKRAVAFHNVQMQDGLLFHSDRPVTAHVRATLNDAGLADCELMCDFRNRAGGLIQKDRPYLRASVQLADGLSPLTTNLAAAPTAFTEFSYPEGGMVYHGPAFRGANGTNFTAEGGWGRILSLPMRNLVGEERSRNWIVPSCVLDAALYACGIHLWTYGDRAISLPRSIERLELGRSPREGEVCVVHVAAREIKSDSAWYEFTVLGDDRAVLIRASGYRKVILARGGAA